MVAVCGGEISATKERHSQPRLRKFIGNDPAAGASTNYDCIHRSFAHSSDDQPSGLTLPRVGLGFWAKSRGLARKTCCIFLSNSWLFPSPRSLSKRRHSVRVCSLLFRKQSSPTGRRLTDFHQPTACTFQVGAPEC